jgi:actin-related protein
MLIEMKDDVASLSTKTMFAKSQFDDDVVADKVEHKLEDLDISNNIEDEEVEENKKIVVKDTDVDAEEEAEDEEEEIKPTKKATGVKVTATKAVRRK